ncbi:MAG: UDP-N-acetyl-D-glucosamine 2-epimerase, UDP-hydrolysing [Candidatus Altiarchaeales archaeon WOR_SM1_79]|nr:MAG: UDP-N-acetyl-D-glucosamine 2-epimerase, UDP-hydrolysing [Candidatus Altiarchaeales archaeon WOR_SM1_79]
MARKICVVTGTRAEYGILKPVMKAIKNSPTLELSVIVTGMHLAQQFGYTLREIEKDGFRINAKVDMLLDSNTGTAMSKSIGNGIISIAQALDIIKPDIILILGDRIEPLAAVIAGAYMNIPVAHIHGGDSANAGLDEYARHAITKLAQIHFPATKESANRIVKMGEDPSNVFVVGAPGLDSILNENLIEPTELSEKYKLELLKPIILVIQHPVTTEVEDAPNQIRETLEAIIELEHQTILIYPNADAGGRKMIEVIKEYERYPFIKTFKSIPHKEYLSLMNITRVMVGNSSGGIIEAPSFGLPVVNVGSRQEGRQRAENVIDVDYDKEQIKAAIKKALYDESFKRKVKKCKNPYGDGKAAVRITDILSKIKIDKKLLQKRLTY